MVVLGNEVVGPHCPSEQREDHCFKLQSLNLTTLRTFTAETVEPDIAMYVGHALGREVRVDLPPTFAGAWSFLCWVRQSEVAVRVTE